MLINYRWGQEAGCQGPERPQAAPDRLLPLAQRQQVQDKGGKP